MRSFPVKSVDILGAEYELIMLGYEDFDPFKNTDTTALVSYATKTIIICDAMTHPRFICPCIADARKFEKIWLRHELIHAFLYESGLHSNANKGETPWPLNEEMVDWIAIQLPKIMRVCKETGAL